MRKLRKLVRSKVVDKPVRIRNYRHDIKNKEVLQRIKEDGWSINKCCDQWSCSKNLILSIVNGTRPDLGDQYTRQKIPKDQLCTSCGIRRKRKGNRFLCAFCFEHGNNDEEDVYYVGFGYSSFLIGAFEDDYEIQEDIRKETKPMVDSREKQNNSGKTKGHDDSTKGNRKKTGP